jgi:hypothetical protein
MEVTKDVNANHKVRVLVAIAFSIIILGMWIVGFSNRARQHVRWEWTSTAISQVNEVVISPYVPINYDLQSVKTISTAIVITNSEQIVGLATNISSGQYDRKLWKNWLEHWVGDKYVVIRFSGTTQEVVYAVNEHRKYPIASAIECIERDGIMREQGGSMWSDELYRTINQILESNNVSWVKGQSITKLQR